MLPSSPSNDITLRVSQMPFYTIHSWHHSYAWKEPYHTTSKSALCLPERKKKVSQKVGGGRMTYWYLLHPSCLLSLRRSPERSLRSGRGWGPEPECLQMWVCANETKAVVERLRAQRKANGSPGTESICRKLQTRACVFKGEKLGLQHNE